MSKRVTVCFLGRKVLTKINDGQTSDQLLTQINQKHGTAYKHVWLSESGNEGEIDDLDVVDNGESLFLTEGSNPPAEEAARKATDSQASSQASSPLIQTPSADTVNITVSHVDSTSSVASLGASAGGLTPSTSGLTPGGVSPGGTSPAVGGSPSGGASPNLTIDSKRNSVAPNVIEPLDEGNNINLDLLHSSLLAIAHHHDDTSDTTTDAITDTPATNTQTNNNTGSAATSTDVSPFSTGGHAHNNHNHNSSGNHNSIGSGTGSNSTGNHNSTGSGTGSLAKTALTNSQGSPGLRPRSTSGKLGEVMSVSDFLIEGADMEVFEPKGRVLTLGVFSLDFEEAIQSYSKNPSKKKKELFMDKALVNAPQEEAITMSPGNVVDIGVGHNTVVSVTEEGVAYIAGAYLLVPACLGQPKPRVAPSPPFLHPDMLTVDIAGQKEIWYVASGAFHSACITRDNEVITWGYNINCMVTGSKAPEIEASIRDRKYVISGQLGHALKGQKSAYFAAPQVVEGLARYGDICQVACGGAHSAALTAEGQLLTWGSNDEGQLGWSPLQIKQHVLSTPCPVIALNKMRVAHVACGSHHTIVCDVKGKVFTWGYNNKGQLGVETREVISSNPQHVSAISEHKVEMVAAGATHSVVLTDAGIVLTWGSNEFGELGRTKNKNRPDQPAKLADYIITHIAAGPHSTSAVTDEGLAFVWGKLAGEKMGGHEPMPRMLQSLFEKKYFICKVGCGLTHFSFLLDDQLTSLVESYINYCDEKVNSSNDELTQATLELPPPLLRRVQTRAFRNIIEKRKDAPIIKVSKTQLFFGVTEDNNFVSIQDLTVTNITENKMNIKGSLEMSKYKTHLSFEPKMFDNVKPGQSVTFRVALAASMKLSYKDLFYVTAEPIKGLLSAKGGGLRYFVVYNFDERDDSSSNGMLDSPARTLSRAATMKVRPSPSTKPPLLPRAVSEKAPTKQDKYNTMRGAFASIDWENADLEIFERLGSGGSLATVYRCTLNGFTCAMKELGEAPPEVQTSFLNEITLIEGLSNDNIVRYLGHYVTPSKQIRLFMEYYPMSLADLIKKRKSMPASEAKTIARDVAKGLEYLHKQTPPVIHRDIKPGNCLIALDQMERVKVVKITDFDISKALFEGAAAMTCAGTTVYMAPEVFSGKPYSTEADVWSFGMMMLEVVTQKHPYHQHRSFDVPKLICDGVLPELTPEIIADESYKALTDIIYECFKPTETRPSAKDLVVKLLSI